MFTYITTYCDEPELLERFLIYHNQPRDYKVIVVDDCSEKVSAISIFKRMGVKDISLFRITSLRGFNSHGARNLAMQHTTTKWNALVDIDYEPKEPIKIEQVIDKMSVEHPYFFNVSSFLNEYEDRYSVNDFFITKDLFWKAGGYDTEFIGMHYGDRIFIERVAGNKRKIVPFWLQELRSSRKDLKYVETDELVQINNNQKNEFIYSTGLKKMVEYTEKKVMERWNNNIMCDPVPFKWVKQL